MNFEEFERMMNHIMKTKEQHYNKMKECDDAMILLWDEYYRKEIEK